MAHYGKSPYSTGKHAHYLLSQVICITLAGLFPTRLPGNWPTTRSIWQLQLRTGVVVCYSTGVKSAGRAGGGRQLCLPHNNHHPQSKHVCTHAPTKRDRGKGRCHPPTQCWKATPIHISHCSKIKTEQLLPHAIALKIKILATRQKRGNSSLRGWLKGKVMLL